MFFFIRRSAGAEHIEHLKNYERTTKLLEIGIASRQEFETVRTKYETAQAKLDEAKKRLERANLLLKINLERKNEIDRSLTRRRRMEAKADAELQNLLVQGFRRNRQINRNMSRKIKTYC